MDDCTEKVRLVAVQAVANAARGERCEQCSEKSCCNEKIVKQLAKIAYERDDHGCWLEPSERVRDAAVKALGICCPNPVPFEPLVEEPIEEDRERPLPEEAEAPEVPAGPTPTPSADSTTQTEDFTVQVNDCAVQVEDNAPQRKPSRFRSSRRHAAAHGWASVPARTTGSAGQPRPKKSVPSGKRIMSVALQLVKRQPLVGARPNSKPHVTHTPRAAAGGKTAAPRSVHGTVQHVDVQRGVAHVRLGGDWHVAVGAQAKIYHRYITGPASLGMFEVLQSSVGAVNVRPVGQANLGKVGRGDKVVVISQ
jgi:hypothetical protein